jgi:hypothetical protein
MMHVIKYIILPFSYFVLDEKYGTGFIADILEIPLFTAEDLQNLFSLPHMIKNLVYGRSFPHMCRHLLRFN